MAEAADGVEALTMARQLTPDLMLLALRMPNVAGAAVLNSLRTDPNRALRELPVILMTSVSEAGGDPVEPGADVVMLAAAEVPPSLEHLSAYTEEHHIALTLQRALLPRALPSCRG